MKKYLASLLLTIFISTSSFAENLKAYFTYCTFSTPNSGPYIETYLSVVGNSAVYKKIANNSYQSKIEITLIFKQGNEIKTFKKYNLLSPEITDSLASRTNFIDQQRISLPNGKYEFEITINDLNSNNTPFKSTQILTIDYPENKINISDIELIESLSKTKTNNVLSKNGYDIIPYTSDFYPEDFEKIAFYAEIYNANKLLGDNEDFLISYYIETDENKKIIGNYKSFIRAKSTAVNILLKSFTIEKLPSGNYNLVIEARNKENELLAQKKVFFQRSNPKIEPLLIFDDFSESFVAKMSKKEIEEYIKCIEPISSTTEINFAENQLKGDDEELMRQFFYNFWIKRSESNPETEWKNYYKLVEQTNKLFSNQLKKGYRTDRGIIYLKYGPPNTRSEFLYDNSTYPYEIWHYHKVERFSNRKFVFYDPSFGMNEYPILHSDMPGHINNKQWRLQLNKRLGQPIDHDAEAPSYQYGDRSSDYYNNPR
ncbi:MAG: GWxTD domain-containing protein [Flavobacteriales bacterium]|nr:GWxTD domain-containing protein [Flavobacteriales bacterium]